MRLVALLAIVVFGGVALVVGLRATSRSPVRQLACKYGQNSGWGRNVYPCVDQFGKPSSK